MYRMNGHILGLTLFFVGILTSPASLAQSCDAEKINAFKSIYKKDRVQVTVNDVFSKTCSSRTSANGISITLPVEGVPLSLGATSKGVQHACATNDKQFFQTYEEHLLYVHASDPVKLALAQACFGGVTMLAKEDSGSITVDVFARSRSNQGVNLTEFVVSPPSAVNAVGKQPEPNQALKPAGHKFVYTRNSGVDITFVAKTENDGSAEIRLPGTSIFPIKWEHQLAPPNKDRAYRYIYFFCMASVAGAKLERVGGVEDARLYGIQNANGELRNSFCRWKYGNSLYVLAGSSLPRNSTDKWDASPKVANDFSVWSCKRNETLLDDAQCPYPNAKSQLCTTDVGRKLYCVSMYGNLRRTPEEDRGETLAIPGK